MWFKRSFSAKSRAIVSASSPVSKTPPLKIVCYVNCNQESREKKKGFGMLTVQNDMEASSSYILQGIFLETELDGYRYYIKEKGPRVWF